MKAKTKKPVKHKLGRCPNCGEHDVNSMGPFSANYVTCSRCGMHGPVCYSAFLAIEAWNRLSMRIWRQKR